MKNKQLAASILLLFMFSGLYAQRFSGGIRGGLVASEVSGDNLAGPNKLGWYASSFTFTPVSDYASIMLEVMYIQKGSRSIPSEKNNFYEYQFNLQYVEIPVQYRLDISRFTETRFFESLVANVGLSASILVDSYESDDGTVVPPEEREDFHPLELNFLLGVSYPLSSSIDFHFGFSNSLTPIRPHAGGGKVWYNRGQYNTLWTFGIAYVVW